jgi:hypothetical protein
MTYQSSANSTDDSMLRGKRQIEQVKVKMALQLDDRTFQLMLSETQVTQTKDHTKWNYEILVELFEGPLLGPRRIEEALRWNKFGKKLMNFWHPSARRFSEVRKTKVRDSCARGKKSLILLPVDNAMDQARMFDSVDVVENSGRGKVSPQ